MRFRHKVKVESGAQQPPSMTTTHGADAAASVPKHWVETSQMAFNSLRQSVNDDDDDTQRSPSNSR